MSSSASPVSKAFEILLDHIAATGFVFEPWQLAAYVTALRTKPFVILAGVSGTGKSKLPQLVAAATGAQFTRIAVRPDWTDTSAARYSTAHSPSRCQTSTSAIGRKRQRPFPLRPRGRWCHGTRARCG